ncbi:MAG: hypothetical protein Q8L55_15465 [Phycisphaerales bacterium]|nr:hypothetical protein [Phycisphaerales bacterium]
MKLKEQVARLIAPTFSEHGFAQVTPLVFERPLQGLCHGVEFVNGTGGRKGRFTVNFYLRYTNSPRIDTSAMDCCFRINALSSCADPWCPIDCEADYAWVLRVFLGPAAEFFQSHASIHAVLESASKGTYSDAQLFGNDPGWRCFHMGFCHLTVGHKENAAMHLRAVVEQHSDQSYEWVKERARLAADALTSIEPKS